MEPDEGLEKLQLAFHVCSKYRENFEDRRSHLAEYFKDEPVVEWDFESSLVFTRVDRLISQLRLMEVSFVQSYLDFRTLSLSLTSLPPPSLSLSRNISTWSTNT